MLAKDCEGYIMGVTNLRDCLLTKFSCNELDDFKRIEETIKSVSNILIDINKEAYKKMCSECNEKI